MKPRGAAISLSYSSRCLSTYRTHRNLFDDSPQPLSLQCHPNKLMLSTWSAVNRCLFLLMTIPAFEKAHSDVALDACAQNRCLDRFAISGYFTWYLTHHCNTLLLLKSLAPLTISTGLSNHLVTNASHSSSSDPQQRDVRGIVVTDCRKVDFHHSSLRGSTTMQLLPLPSCSEEDAPDPWLFLCKICRQH